MRKLVSAVASAALLSAGLAAVATAGGATAAPARTAPAPAHRGYTPPPIHWGTCASSSLQSAGAKCGMVTVPLDYAKPGGTKIKLAVSRIKHDPSVRSQGVMLVNPGGPGGSGLGLARLGAYVPNGGGAPYDWIGFDPRGVGSSQPSLSCDEDFFAAGRPSYVPTTPQLEDYWQDKAVGYSVACKEANLKLLKHTDTRTWVQDMESIRKALHQQKINYYGFSYGTYLGQVYATQHPDRVRRFVFDGVVNPKDVWYAANLEQDKQFDTNIDTYFDWIAAHDDTYGLGTDGDAVRQIYYDTLQDLSDHPQAHFGAADWNDVFVSAAYYVYGWDDLAHVLVAAADGDLGPAKEWYGDPTGPGSDNTYANYLAVQCADAPWPEDWSTWQQDNDALYAEHPFLTWNNAWYNAPCRTWPARSGTPVKVNGAKVPPILLIEETDDAATPWAGALEVRKRFTRSVLIEGVDGTTHAGSLSGVGCTDNRIARYLKTGALPDRKPGNGHSDVQCAPVSPPAPSAAGTRTTPRERLLTPARPVVLH
ncbi:alpha/beta hydrolase [Nocardioides sp.]|uniref:alpha/beta hydrolase n=1 Tax=Nocardioides sp. TaxID=35761 RepID=UPI0037846FB0